MKITEFPEYKSILAKFESGEFKFGNVCDIPIYTYKPSMESELTPGHYVGAMNYATIPFADVPEKYRTREFFVNALSPCTKDIIEYVKQHVGDIFDKQFFKDHIATEHYSIEFEDNCFSYMPLEYIDEEMVACAMIKATNSRYVERRGDFDCWFYSVAKRKPQLLTQDYWTLGARNFAEKRGETNKYLSITPDEYKTKEYYFAMCQKNRTRVMEDIPKNILTNDFLVSLLHDDVENIASFSEEALETKIFPKNIKCWQIAILKSGYTVKDIPLNDERVEFFLSHYDKDSAEYKFSFKDKYKAFIKTKKHDESNNPKSNVHEEAFLVTSLAMSHMNLGEVIDIANVNLKSKTGSKSYLPIYYKGVIPEKFSKKYDSEEFILEVYKELGIEIVRNDLWYYEVKLPSNIEIKYDNNQYFVIKDNDNVLITFMDVGPFYDRDVYVKTINCLAI